MASQNRFFKFMASPHGRRFSFYATVTASITGFCATFVPNTFLITQHREFVASYREGAERPVSKTIQGRFEIAQELLKLSDFERVFMKSFMVSGFDLYHIGSLKYRFGALVGIPVNFSYTSASEIDKSDIIVRGKPVDWNSQGGKLLEEALVLNEDEQIFGLAREILQLQNQKVFLNSIYPCITIAGTYILASNLNSKMLLFYRPLSLRVMLYMIVGLFGYGVYSFLTDYLQVSYDGETDETLAKYGRPFLEAGVRFYDKLLKKNIAIRELTGDESMYTALGNDNFYFRRKRLPLVIRKDFFELKLKELIKKEEESSNKDATASP